jgi:DNA-binding CsgD family transcriptional regulator
MSLSNEKKRNIISLFSELPDKKSDRNKLVLTPEQVEGIATLREHMTPKEIEQLLNISAYKIIKIINSTK